MKRIKRNVEVKKATTLARQVATLDKGHVAVWTVEYVFTPIAPEE